jgi:hypothetical protein
VPIRKIAKPDELDQEQEQSNRARRAILTGTAVGLAAVAGATFGGAQPARAQSTQPVTQLQPSGDKSGVTDTNNINGALNALATAGTGPSTGGGVLWLAPGQFYVSVLSGSAAITIPEQVGSGTQAGFPCSLMGSGAATVLNMVGSSPGAAVFAHRANNYNPPFGNPGPHTMGFIRDLVIDGTSAPANSSGLDCGSGWGLDVNVTIANFTASGCIGLNQVNRNNWSEKCRFRCHLLNNATACVIGAVGSAGTSHDYSEYDLYLFTYAPSGLNGNVGQTGIVVQNGVNVGGAFFRVHGNIENWPASTSFPPTPPAMLSILDTSTIANALFHVNVEYDKGPDNNSNPPYTIYFGTTSSQIIQSSGEMKFNGGTNSNAQYTPQSGQFQFKGLVSGDPALTGAGGGTFTPPPMPASNHPQPNTGPVPMMVYVAGSTVSSVKINGVATGQTSGAFYVPLNATISVVYTGTLPTWVWVPCSAGE